MIDYSQWIDKLKLDLPDIVPEVKNIGFARDAQKLKTSTSKNVPCVFVLPFAEDVEIEDSTETNIELITQKVEVVTVVRDGMLKDGTELQSVRNGIHQVLMGWQIPNAFSDVHMESGRRSNYNDGFISWSDIYSVKILRN